jgi:hypothetical protein
VKTPLTPLTPAEDAPSFSATAAAVVQAYERMNAVRALEADFERGMALSGRWRVDRSEEPTVAEGKGE